MLCLADAVHNPTLEEDGHYWKAAGLKTQALHFLHYGPSHTRKWIKRLIPYHRVRGCITVTSCWLRDSKNRE